MTGIVMPIAIFDPWERPLSGDGVEVVFAGVVDVVIAELLVLYEVNKSVVSESKISVSVDW